MKRLYGKVFVLLLLFFILILGSQYFLSSLAIGKRDAITFLVFSGLAMLVILMLMFLVLGRTILRPLDEINRNLLSMQRNEGNEMLVFRRSFFKEVRQLYANINDVYRQINQKIRREDETSGQFSTLQRTMQLIVVTFDLRLRATSINEFGQKLLQLEPGELPNLRISEFVKREFTREIARELQTSDNLFNRETVLTLKNGEKIEVNLSIAKIFGPNRELKSFIAVVADITKRKKAESNLKNQILYSQQIFQSIPEIIIITDHNLRITFINRRAKEMVKRIEANIIGQNITLLLSSKSSEIGFDELIRNVIAKGNGINQINVLNPFLDEENYVDLSIEPLKAGAMGLGSIILLRDISEWRNLTAQLRALQGFMQKVINASPYAVISINNNSMINTWNLSAERIMGVSFPEAFGKNLYEIMPVFNQFKDVINEVLILEKTIYLSDEKIFIGEDNFIVANLTLYPVSAEQNGVVIHIEDVSEIKKLESSLIQAQKMGSLGLLTSNIIHDFNNLLSGIMGYASLLEKKISQDPKLTKYVTTIISSSERAANLINQLLDYSRKKLAEKETININDLIREALEFIAFHLKNIHLDIRLHPDKILLNADKTKISQIIINLILNARDALEGVAEPMIIVKTGRMAIKDYPKLADGDYISIDIADNGSGISKENLSKIFEPFFTTKGHGQGTGLGLAIVKEIIKDYSGDIAVDSEIGRGTVFRILLPALSQEATAAPQEIGKEAEAAIEGSVLLIDDEEVVREIGVDMLKTIGLTCLTAANGEEGIEVFKKNIADIRLVILDIEMPGISGEKVYHILREIKPQIRILIASGYSKDYLESRVFNSRIEHFIAKPFKIEQLSHQVYRLLKAADV